MPPSEISAPPPPIVHESIPGKRRSVVYGILFVVAALMVYWFVYQSSVYLSTFSHRIGGGEGNGFYVVTYPTHKRVFYFRHWVGGEWFFQTFAMQVGFIEGADPKTFDVLGAYYAKDKNSIFFAFDQSRVVAPIPITGEIKLLSDYYVANGDSVYFENRELTNARASDFVFLDPPTAAYENVEAERTFDARFARSGSSIYYGAEPVTARQDGAFIKSITHTSIPCTPAEKQYSPGNTVCQLTSDGTDQQVAIDAATFSVLQPTTPLHAYAKDKNNVYYMERKSYGYCGDCGVVHKVDGADAASFTAGGRDDLHTYANGCRIYETEVDSGVTRRAGVGYGYCDYF